MATNLSPQTNQQTQQQALLEIVSRLAAWGVPYEEAAFTLANAVTWTELDPRDHLFAQDSYVDAIYLLLEGRIFQERIHQDAPGHRRVTLRREAHPGEWLGHYDLLYTQQYGTRARALDFTRLIKVDAGPLNRLINRYPRLRRQMAPLEKIERLRTVPLLGALDLTALSYVADACRIQRIPADAIVYTPQQTSDHIFIVDQGQLELRDDQGGYFLLGNGMAAGFVQDTLDDPTAPPSYQEEARATVPSTLFVIARRDLRELADIDPEETGNELRRMVASTIDATPVFVNYSQDDRRILAGYMSHYYIPTHHLVTQQGELADSLWLLPAGSNAMLHALEEGQALQPTFVQGPNFFGELALRVEHTLSSTIQAEPGSHWLRLHEDDFLLLQRNHGGRFGEQLQLSPLAEKVLGRQQTRRRYTWLQEGENLIVLHRRHWLALVRGVLFSLLLSTGLAIFWLVMAVQGWLALWAWWVIGILGSISLLQFIWGILDYFNDFLLVTNQRLVRQEKVLFLTEWRQAAFLEQIRNVDTETDFLGNALGYGTVTIHTAAESGAIAFDFVPNHQKLKQTILEQQSQRLQHYQASSRMVIQNLLEERFGLRLQLPARVRPEVPRPTIQLEAPWWRTFLSAININNHLAIKTSEKIIWRKHWFVLIGRIATPGLILAVILSILIGESLLPPEIYEYILPLNIMFALGGLGALIWFAWNVADWRNDTYEVNEEQIADIEKKPLFFAENRREALLGDIENIEINIPSPIHYWLDFGDVLLQTAASQGLFTFNSVPDPRGVSEEIRRRIEQYRYQQEANRTRQRAQELPDWFEMYKRLERDQLGPAP